VADRTTSQPVITERVIVRRILAVLVAALAAALCLAAPAAAQPPEKGNAKGNAELYGVVNAFQVPTDAIGQNGQVFGCCSTTGWTAGIRYGGHFGITYQKTGTFGPYNGEAHWSNDLPGQVPDGEALQLSCDNNTPIIRGGQRINLKTIHGTADQQVLTFNGIHDFWDSENDTLGWGGFVTPTGEEGWNSVTISVLCFRAYNLSPAV